MKKLSATKKPTRLDALTASVERDWAHANSAVIGSRVRILQFEGEELDKSIMALRATITNVIERRKVIDATLRGLSAVIAKR